MATLAVTNDFSAGTTIVASEVNTNFGDIETFVNTTPGVVQKDIVDAKGDLVAATAADAVARLAVGSNDQVLTADSSEATGLKWASAAADATKMPLAGGTFTGAVTYQGASPILLTGATTGNGYEITLAITDPTADRTITLPNAAGTVALTGGEEWNNANNVLTNSVFN
jgi:hypothetical protein